MSSAREVLTSSEVGFISDRCSPLTVPRVDSASRRCSVNTSLSLKNSSMEDALWWPCSSARVREASLPQTMTFMPKARA